MQISKDTQYTISTNYKINYEKLSDLTNTKHFIDGDNLYVIQIEVLENTTGFYEKQRTELINRVVTKEFFDKICENPEQFKELEKQYTTKNPVLLVRKDFLPMLEAFGSYNLPRVLGLKNIETHVSYYNADLYLLDVKDSDFQFIQYLDNPHHKVVAIDSDGVKHMEPFIMDYIHGQLSNEHYHLDELVEYLSKRDDISFFIEKTNTKNLLVAPLKGDEKGIETIIQDIPYYNAEPDSTEFINIVYYPKKDDVEKLLSWNQEDPENNKKQIYDLSSFAMKEIIGCLQFTKKIDLDEELTDRKPKRKFKS